MVNYLFVRDKISIQKLFFIGMTALIVITIIGALLTNGDIFKYIFFFPDENDTFMDFFKVIVHTRNPYAEGSLYPPFIMFIFILVKQLFPLDLIYQGPFEMRDSQIGIMLFLLICLLLFMVYINISIRLLGFSNIKLIIICIMALSYPFLFCFERGNCIYLAFVLSMIFIAFYKEQRFSIRMIAYVALGMAAAVKIYPAVLGLLILVGKKKIEAIIPTIIGVALSLFPFLFFIDESKYISTYLSSMVNSEGTYLETCGFGLSHSLYTIVGSFSYMSNKNLGFLYYIFAGVVFIINVGIICVDKKIVEWKKYTLLVILMVMIPKMSYSYVLLFFAIPCFVFLKEECNSRINIIYCILFIVIMGLIPSYSGKDILGSDYYYPLLWSNVIRNIAITIMEILLAFGSLKSIIEGGKNEKE